MPTNKKSTTRHSDATLKLLASLFLQLGNWAEAAKAAEFSESTLRSILRRDPDRLLRFVDDLRKSLPGDPDLTNALSEVRSETETLAVATSKRLTAMWERLDAMGEPKTARALQSRISLASRLKAEAAQLLRDMEHDNARVGDFEAFNQRINENLATILAEKLKDDPAALAVYKEKGVTWELLNDPVEVEILQPHEGEDGEFIKGGMQIVRKTVQN